MILSGPIMIDLLSYRRPKVRAPIALLGISNPLRSNRHFDLAFTGHLLKDGVKQCISHPCACPQSALLQLTVMAGQYPENAVTRRL